ncbi:MAG: bifunctional DNA primase/polymerase [Acidobacteriota bacterium]|nr:bifunctional DNA primase/polymerase [Acidobacteriota bacterium]
MSAQPSYKNDKAEDYARWRRRDHANIEAMQNLVIAGIAEESGVEMPPNVRLLISALQGAHGGGEVAYEPFERSYQSIGAQLQFTGTGDAIEARVRRWVNDLLSWQDAALVELFSVVKGGQIIGNRPDGTPIRKATTFIDHLQPKADEAVQRARASEQWKGSPAKGIKPHPGLALAAQVEWLKKELPKLKPKAADAGTSKTHTKQPVAEYAQKREQAIATALEDTADQIEKRHGDADLWLERIEKLVRKMRDSRRKTLPARRSWIMLDDEEDAEEKARDGNTAYKGDKFDPADAPDETGLGYTDVTQADAENPENTPVSEAENEPSAREWALTFASQGIGVFPLKSREKIPLGRLTPNGCKNATTDEAVISRWFEAEPRANLAVAMGGKLRLLGVDMDSRHGGNASLYDLCETHGEAWLDTFTVKTGDNGRHFYFRLPEGVEVHRAKLAPGIDIKAEGGYLVAPPSIHPNGNRYEVEKNTYIAEAPPWLVKELTRRPEEPPAKVIDFQERRDATGNFGTRIFHKGGRNNGLRDVAYGRWVNGWAESEADLIQQTLEVNATRCVPPLPESEAVGLARSAARNFARGEQRQQGGAACAQS